MREDGVGAVTERGSAVELFSNPGHGDQRNGGSDDIELQDAQPGQILQMGITHKVNHHKRDDDLVHGRLLHKSLLDPLIGVDERSVMETFRKSNPHHICIVTQNEFWRECDSTTSER